MVALLVVFTVFALVLVDVALQRAQARRGVVAVGVVAAQPAGVEAVSVPRGLFVDAGHTWFRLEPSGQGTVGVDEFAAGVLGRIDRVEAPAVGREVRRGDPLFTVRQKGRTATFRAPLDGVVTAVNAGVADDTGSLTSDPYRRGWVCRLQPARLAEGLRSLFVGDETETWVRDEVQRLRDLLGRRRAVSPLGATAQDGGSIVRGVLEHVDDLTWGQVAEQHFRAAPSR